MIYQDEKITIFKTEFLWHGNLTYNNLAKIQDYTGKYFVLERSESYGFFKNMTRMYTKGEILDKYGILLNEL